MGFMQFTSGAFLLLITAAKESNAFKKCYNTSTETNCFEVQYDDANNRWLTSSADDARRRCIQRNSTLVVIKNEEVNGLIQQFKRESENPVSGQNIWTDAVRIDDYNNTYTWHWINRKLPNIQASDVSYTYSALEYVAVLELRRLGGSNENWQYYLTAKRAGDSYSCRNYVCEYDESNCSSVVSSAKISDGRCYIPYSEQVTWYEARNRCLMRGGDLVSFKNVTNFNFTSFLDFTPQDNPLRAYWIGLRFTWYLWNGLGTELDYLKWMENYDHWSTSRCLILYAYCSSGCVLRPFSCDNTRDVYVVCHTVTPLLTTTTEAPTTTLHYTTTASLADNITFGITVNNTKLFNSDQVNNGTPQVVSLAVGISVGVGVPVIIATIVIIICVVRKRRQRKANSMASSDDHVRDLPDQSDQSEGDAVPPAHPIVLRPSKSKQSAESTDQNEAKIPIYSNRETLLPSSSSSSASKKAAEARGQGENMSPVYGTVLPSVQSKNSATTEEENEPRKDDVDYAPLNFL